MEVPMPVYNPIVPFISYDARSQSASAHIALIKAAMLRSAQETLDGEGFTQLMPQLLTTLSGACGDPGTLIPVSLRGRTSYLRQTSQLHLEPLMRELGKVYSVERSFRAERHTDERHLTEFTLIEAEAAGYSLPELMTLIETLVVAMLSRAAASSAEHFSALGADAQKLAHVETPFPRITYDKAIIALQRRGFFIEWGEDLSNLHEIALAELACGPLFVTHYPVELRFFTMKINRSDPRVVECCDLILPGVGEVMGASETENDPALLESRMLASKGIRQQFDLGGNADDYRWYIDMHNESSAGQAGFGMGFERLVRFACALPSVAEVVS